MPLDLALLSSLNGSNNPCLELIFMVPKVVDCICKKKSTNGPDLGNAKTITDDYGTVNYVYSASYIMSILLILSSS